MKDAKVRVLPRHYHLSVPTSEHAADGSLPRDVDCACCAPAPLPPEAAPRSLSRLGVGRLALVAHLVGDAATCGVVLGEALFLRYGARRLSATHARNARNYLDPVPTRGVARGFSLSL